MEHPEDLVDWYTPLLVRALNGVGLGDHLGHDVRSTAELAEATGLAVDTLRRSLRLLAARGLVASRPGDCWQLTEDGGVLRSDHPDSVALAGPQGIEVAAWGRMPETLRTGQAAFPMVFGMSFWQWLEEHPEDRAAFDARMVRRLPLQLEMTGSYPWPESGHVVDVGGGTGTLLLRVLEGRPGLTGTLYDVPATVAAARDVVDRSPAADRLSLEAGDFFTSVPQGDLHVLSQILHDWPDEDALRILASVRAAMRPHGRVLLLESVIPPGDGREGLKVLDLHMLAMFGGRERTHEEWEALLSRAGLRLDSVIAGPRVSWLVARCDR